MRIRRDALMKNGRLAVVGMAAVVLFGFGWSSRSSGSGDLAIDVGEAGGVLLVFQPDDCEGNLQFTEYWNDLQARPGIEVRGQLIGAPASSRSRTELVRRAGIDFPVLFHTSRRLPAIAADAGHRSTPLALVVDANGRVLFLIPPGVPPHLLNLERILRGTR
jgi:hypothetical protein